MLHHDACLAYICIVYGCIPCAIPDGMVTDIHMSVWDLGTHNNVQGH